MDLTRERIINETRTDPKVDVGQQKLSEEGSAIQTDPKEWKMKNGEKMGNGK